MAPWRLLKRFLSVPKMSGNVRESRRRGAERRVKQDVLRRVRRVVVAAHDVGDRHVDVVHDDRQVIGRVPVGPQDDQIPDRGVVHVDRPVDHVVEPGPAWRDLEPNGMRRPVVGEAGQLLLPPVQARAVVLPPASCRLGGLALLL